MPRLPAAGGTRPPLGEKSGEKPAAGDSLGQSNGWRLIAFSKIDPGERNVRKTYREIPKLAESIEQHGLLQNLVVRAGADGRYLLECGGRRYRALTLLVEQGKIQRSHEVPCLVFDTGEGLEELLRNLVENLQRQEVPAWQLGRRYNELRETCQLSQSQIAGRINKTQGHVSIYCQIADGLAPAVVKRLDSLPSCPLNNSQLLRIAKIYDEKNFEPSETAQLELLEQFLGASSGTKKPRGPRKALSEKKRVWLRYEKLKHRGVRIPAHALPYLDAVLRYLRGEDATLRFPLSDE